MCVSCGQSWWLCMVWMADGGDEVGGGAAVDFDVCDRVNL